jgi:hypothetical protein
MPIISYRKVCYGTTFDPRSAASPAGSIFNEFNGSSDAIFLPDSSAQYGRALAHLRVVHRLDRSRYAFDR